MIYTPQPCYFAVTDPRWFKFHRQQNSLEVNFWRPSGTAFKALKPGQNLLFKLKNPYNHIAGGGTFVRYEKTRLSEAWRLYGEMNGCHIFGEFQQALLGMNKTLQSRAQRDPEIGCIILEGCHYYGDEEWIECPDSFRSTTVSGKTYGIDLADGQAINAEFEARRSCMLLHRADQLPASDPFRQTLIDWDDERSQPQFGTPYLTRPRLGQGGFRSLVLDAYGKQCAITSEHTEPVLEAAHIVPYSDGGAHSLNNALLLRSDFHTLFDRGYVTVTPDYKLEVSDSIRAHFNNGVRYEQRRGSLINLPQEVQRRPDPELLRWHNDHVFMG